MAPYGAKLVHLMEPRKRKLNSNLLSLYSCSSAAFACCGKHLHDGSVSGRTSAITDQPNGILRGGC
jgi:hypothetical protein